MSFIEYSTGPAYWAIMATDLVTVVILGATGAALTLRAFVDVADTAEKAIGYVQRGRQAFNRAFIGAMIYSRRRSSRLLNFLWLLSTGHPIFRPENDPPPTTPGGGRRMRSGFIASIGVGTRFAEPKVATATASASSSR